MLVLQISVDSGLIQVLNLTASTTSSIILESAIEFLIANFLFLISDFHYPLSKLHLFLRLYAIEIFFIFCVPHFAAEVYGAAGKTGRSIGKNLLFQLSPVPRTFSTK